MDETEAGDVRDSLAVVVRSHSSVEAENYAAGAVVDYMLIDLVEADCIAAGSARRAVDCRSYEGKGGAAAAVVDVE